MPTLEDADLLNRVVAAIHEGLGGNGWAYSDYSNDELRSMRPELERAARAAIATVNKCHHVYSYPLDADARCLACGELHPSLRDKTSDKRKTTWAKITAVIPGLEPRIREVGDHRRCGIYHTADTVLTRLAHVYWSEELDAD